MVTRAVESVRRIAAMNPLVADTALAVVITGMTLAFEAVVARNPEMLGLGDPAAGFAYLPPDRVSMALSVVVNLPLALRRRAPFTILLVSCGAAFVYHALGYYYGFNTMPPLLALYTVAARRAPGVTAVGAAITLAMWAHTFLTVPASLLLAGTVQACVLIGVAWGFGNTARTLTEKSHSLESLSERLRHDQEDMARRAVTQERVRIARELHDVVAHHMSVISVQAGLARYVFTSDPGTARDALATIAETGSEVMGEMRRLLSVLRIEPEDDGVSYDPAPGLDRLGQLAERVRSAGVPVEVTVRGTARPLAPGIDLCAFRVVQECLTNVLKHAGPARAEVTLSYRPAELELRVTDDGRGRAGSGTDSGGHGLMGMRERVKLYKGTIVAGPRPRGGFEVVVTLPLSSATADEHPPTPAGETSE
ncbi:sensor histidine kinase [Sphaerisporangium corydalis]|uniref:histidine kinase n=1 Tax=Sphaerisporangium corydalis TaxID=1441875 RepID=A0ABV9EAF2_9ACTN|nr:sensor histidine kinase [Sphaerisporangium corydalis]